MSDQYWPGLDREFLMRMASVAAEASGRAFRETLGENWIFSDGKLLPLASPLLVRSESGNAVFTFTPTYHAAIERIVSAYDDCPDVREVLAIPDDLAVDLEADVDPDHGHVHLCRLDFLLDEAGGFRVIETNANCPGGLLFTGMASRAWRRFLSAKEFDLPDPMPHEAEHWMATWYLDVATEVTGERPEFVPLVRQAGGNRLELPHLISELNALGVDAVECDPEEITLAPNGDAMLHGRVVRHAYQKVGMQEFRRRRPALNDYVAAVRSGRLFVQNWLRGRWIGDNKLCLAILSDPSFRSLFEPETMRLMDRHVPWSRNVALVDPADRERVRRCRGDFVLKRPLDTRGRGVVIGRETDRAGWEAALETAVAESWLVQEFHLTTVMDVGEGAAGRHDLAVGAINGAPAGAFSRTSDELRVNVARSGEVHPVFMHR